MESKDKNKERKRKKRQFYSDHQKKQKRNVLQPGVKGILITCNGNERQCVRESYNILNEYGDKLYGPEIVTVGSSEGDKDIEEQLESELNSLKNTDSKERRFKQMDTRVANCLFIRAKVDSPDELVYSIFKDVKETQTQKSRSILRMIPILETCKPYAENIQKTIPNILKQFADDSVEDVSYAIIIKSRHNNSVNKQELISTIYRQISQHKPKWKGDFKNYQLAIIVEILQTVCCIGILKDYTQFRKYNLSEITQPLHSFVENSKTADVESDINPSGSQIDVNTTKDICKEEAAIGVNTTKDICKEAAIGVNTTKDICKEAAVGVNTTNDICKEAAVGVNTTNDICKEEAANETADVIFSHQMKIIT